jgi:hypothetical protein
MESSLSEKTIDPFDVGKGHHAGGGALVQLGQAAFDDGAVWCIDGMEHLSSTTFEIIMAPQPGGILRWCRRLGEERSWPARRRLP